MSVLSAFLKTILVFAIFTSIYFVPANVSSQTTSDSITSGTAWLLSARYGIGLWALTAPPDPLQTEFSATGFTPTYIRDTLEAVRAIQVVNVPVTEYELTMDWAERFLFNTTTQFSYQLQILSKGGRDATQPMNTLIEVQNTDAGFGAAKGYPSNVPDTAQALQALAAAGSTDATAINGAVSYLLAAQNADGGWGFVIGKPSEVYYTAVVMQALETQPQTTAIANALSQATAFLLAHQNADGGFGSSPSTVWETALAFLAISKTTGDVTARTSAINYLITTQQANGSWNDDPYSTALALQALHTSLSQTPPPPPPTTGTLTGTVKDGATQAPLQGVLVEVQAQGLSTMTDASGAFTLSEVTAGTVDLSFMKVGDAVEF
jgi:hypothetical protein